MKGTRKGGITAKGKAFKGTTGTKMANKSGAKKSVMSRSGGKFNGRKYAATRRAVFGL